MSWVNMTKKYYVFSKDYKGWYETIYKKGTKIWGAYDVHSIVICHGMSEFESIPLEYIVPTEEFYSVVTLVKPYAPFVAGNRLCGIWNRNGLAVEHGNDTIIIPTSYFVDDSVLVDTPPTLEQIMDLRAMGVNI